MISRPLRLERLSLIFVISFTLIFNSQANGAGEVDLNFPTSLTSNSHGSGSAAVIQPDGKIIIGGNFTSFNSVSRPYIARLNPDGSLDQSFTTVLNSPVLDLKVQSDGKILLGGSMTSVNGIGRTGIARINADGTLDTSFNTGSGTNSTVWEVDQQTDGKVVYVGQFFRTNGVPTLGIGRLLNSNALAKTPFDFDGDGKSDVSVFRSSSNVWYAINSGSGTVLQENFGVNDDILAPADYDGDGKTDLAVYRPSEGGWYIFNSATGTPTTLAFGVSTDIPVPADYDGDGKADIAVFRPETGIWYLLQSTDGFAGLQFGISTDEPIPSVFQP